MPAGVYALPSFGSYVQSGPIRIRAEQGAIFDGVDAPNDWLNNPLLAQDGSDPNQFLLGTIRFLQFSTTGAAGSPGFPVDIEGLTFRNWTHVFRTTSVAHNNLIPLFRLHRCRFEKCYRGISTWAGAPVTYDRLEITYNTFFQCNVAIDWSGGRWQNVLVHGNFIDMCAREGFRFGYNTDPDIGLGVGILEQHEWRRVVWSFNCATRIGKSAFDPFASYTESNEVHCLRDYSEQVLLIGNMCYDCNAGAPAGGGASSNDAEMVYTKQRYSVATGNFLFSPDGGGDSRALFAFKKGQPREWLLYPDLPEQTNAYSNVVVNNMFVFGGEERGPALFAEGGDSLVINNWFEQCGAGSATGGMIMHGSNAIGNLDQVIVIRGNVMRHCTGWLVGGGVKGGTWYIEDNVINSGLLANEKHLGIITMQGQGFTPPPTDVGPGIDENWRPSPPVDPSYMSRGTTYYIRRNSGDAGTQADVWCKSDIQAHSLTAIVEDNSLVGVVMLVGTSNNAMLRVDIINNDLNGSSNTGQLINIASSSRGAEAAADPRQPGLQTDHHDVRHAPHPAVHHADQRGRLHRVPAARPRQHHSRECLLRQGDPRHQPDCLLRRRGPGGNGRGNPHRRPGDRHRGRRQRQHEHRRRGHRQQHDRLGRRPRRLLRRPIAELTHA